MGSYILFTLTILGLFSAMMLWAAYSDLTSYRLSNRLCLTTALLYPLYLIALYYEGHGLALQTILITVGISAVIFLICAVFFALNFMGGGDVKFIPVVALWAGTAHILPFLFITSIVGGLIAFILIIKNRIKASKYSKSSENINLSMSQKEESAVPYGVGIALGGLYIAYQLAKISYGTP